MQWSEDIPQATSTHSPEESFSLEAFNSDGNDREERPSSQATQPPVEMWLHSSAQALLKQAEKSTARALLLEVTQDEVATTSPSPFSQRRHTCGGMPRSETEWLMRELQLMDGFNSMCLSSERSGGDITDDDTGRAANAAKQYLLAAREGLSPLLRSPATPVQQHCNNATKAPLLLTWHDTHDMARGPATEVDEMMGDSSCTTVPHQPTQQTTSHLIRRRHRDDDGDDDLSDVTVVKELFVDNCCSEAADSTDNDEDEDSHGPLEKKRRWEGCQVPWQNRKFIVDSSSRIHHNHNTRGADATDMNKKQLKLTVADPLLQPPPRKLLISENFLRHARGCAWSASTPAPTSTSAAVDRKLPMIDNKGLSTTTMATASPKTQLPPPPISSLLRRSGSPIPPIQSSSPSLRKLSLSSTSSPTTSMPLAAGATSFSTVSAFSAGGSGGAGSEATTTLLLNSNVTSLTAGHHHGVQAAAAATSESKKRSR